MSGAGHVFSPIRPVLIMKTAGAVSHIGPERISLCVLSIYTSRNPYPIFWFRKDQPVRVVNLHLTEPMTHFLFPRLSAIQPAANSTFFRRMQARWQR